MSQKGAFVRLRAGLQQQDTGAGSSSRRAGPAARCSGVATLPGRRPGRALRVQTPLCPVWASKLPALLQFYFFVVVEKLIKCDTILIFDSKGIFIKNLHIFIKLLNAQYRDRGIELTQEINRSSCKTKLHPCCKIPYTLFFFKL